MDVLKHIVGDKIPNWESRTPGFEKRYGNSK